MGKKEIKIVNFVHADPGGGQTFAMRTLTLAEKVLTELVNDGWTIITAGGAGYNYLWGFIVLERTIED